MDYSAGTELWKYQWDYIHNPEGGVVFVGGCGRGGDDG
jgi:hypothetical protein